MRPLFQRSGVPTGRSSTTKKALFLSLIAAPVVFLEAPSQAGTKLFTSSGFTGQFASNKWTATNSGGGTGVFTPTTLTLSKAAASSGQATRQQAVNAAFINSFGAPATFTFLKAIVTYDYTWDVAGGANSSFSFSEIGPYTPIAGAPPVSSRTILNISAPTAGSVTQDVLATEAFGFQVFRNGGVVAGTPGVGTAVISNFKVAAEYEVPGPLPLAGAAAAFAWSRKLRNRLKLSESLG